MTHQSETELNPPHEKKPRLFLRRIAGIVIDYIILNFIIILIGFCTNSSTLELITSWFIFFSLWYILINKKRMYLGQNLAGIIITFSETETDKSSRLLFRFAITWLPLFFWDLTDIEQTTNPVIDDAGA